MRVLARALQFSQEKVGQVIEPGDAALDATCGNGYDTLFLAGCVGPRGRVFSFDIQDRAVDATSRLLHRHGLAERVSLLKADHETILNHIHSPLKAAMFNLGYLPGGDHRVVTRPASTIKALEGAVFLLQSGGLISIVAYSGHPGGDVERDSVREFLAALDQRKYAVLHYGFVNQINHPPQLFLIEKQ